MISMTNNKGRERKFTPERIEQIRNLIERGTSREEIAEIIGCTVGSLQVTCSRLGISLRRQRPDNGVRLLPRPPSAAPIPLPRVPSLPAANGNGPTLALVLVDGDRRRESPLPLAVEDLRRIALEAAVRGVSVADVMTALLVKGMNSLD